MSGSSRSWRIGPVAWTIILSLCATLLLHAWRPLFHLNDDNMTGWMPVAVEMYQKLWSGQWPFLNTSLFGGEYDVLRDPTVFGLLSPWTLLFSWLALTDYYFLLPDVVSTLSLLTIAACFSWFAIRMREVFKLGLPDWMIVAASFSYAFTPFNFLVGGSWIGFINAQASLPLVIAGLYSTSFRRGTGLMAVAMIYAIYGSHLHPFIFMMLFAGAFAVGVAVLQKSPKVLLRFAATATVACLAASPVLISSFLGFTTSDRHSALSLEAASAYSIPVLTLVGSFVGGPLAGFAVTGMPIHFSDGTFNLALAYAIINVPLIYLVCRKRRFSGVEWILVGCIAVVTIFIARPAWLGEAMLQLPLMKSLRWPFRELAVLHFFAHFLFILNARPLKTLAGRASIGVGVLVYATVLALPAPTFNTLYPDRDLITSGRAREFWATLQTRLGNSQIVSAAPPMLVLRHASNVPFSLLGAYNYASILGIVNASGYSPTLPGSGIGNNIRPYHHAGIFTPQAAAAMVKLRPDLATLTLLNVEPTIIEVARREQRYYYRFDATTLNIEEVQPPSSASAASLGAQGLKQVDKADEQ